MNHCPDSKTLASYVSGSLPEQLADTVVGHLDSCASCQKRADALANEADTLVDAIRWRQSSSNAGTEADTVNRLIARAQNRPPELPRPPKRDTVSGSQSGPPTSGSSSGDESIALDVFVTCLHKSRLMHRSEIELLVEMVEPPDSDEFARALIARGKLTPFQATALK